MKKRKWIIISMACILLFGCGRTSMWDRLEKTRTDVKEALDDLSAEEAAIIAAWHASPKTPSRKLPVQSHQQLLLKYPNRMLEDALENTVISEYFGGLVEKYFIGMTFGADVPTGVRLDRGLDEITAFNDRSPSFVKFPSGPVLLLNPAGFVAYSLGTSLAQHGKEFALNSSKAAIGLAAEKLGEQLLKHRQQLSDAIVMSVTNWLRSPAGIAYSKEMIREGIDQLSDNSFNMGFNFSLGSFLANTLGSELFSMAGKILGIKDQHEEMMKYIADSLGNIFKALSAMVVQLSNIDRHVSVLEHKTLSVPIWQSFNAIMGRETDLAIFITSGESEKAAEMARAFIFSGVIHEMMINVLTFGKECVQSARANHIKDIGPNFRYVVKLQDRKCKCQCCASVFGVCLLCDNICGQICEPEITEERPFIFSGDIGSISFSDLALLLRVMNSKFYFLEVGFGHEPALCATLKAANARILRPILMELKKDLNDSFERDIISVKNEYAAGTYYALKNTTPETLAHDLDRWVLYSYDYVAKYNAALDAALVLLQGYIIAAEEYE